MSVYMAILQGMLDKQLSFYTATQGHTETDKPWGLISIFRFINQEFYMKVILSKGKDDVH